MDEFLNFFVFVLKYVFCVFFFQVLWLGFLVFYVGIVKFCLLSYEEELYFVWCMEVCEEFYYVCWMYFFDDVFGYVDDQVEYGRGRVGVNVFDFEE